MSKGRDRTIYKDTSGGWANKRNDASKPGKVHDTQGAAIAEAKRQVKQDGGGELTVKGRDGKIRSKDTIAPGNDPFPPRDREH